MKSQNGALGRLKNLARENIKLAKRLDAGRSPSALNQLRNLTLHFGFSLATGEILRMNGGWYVTHAALLRLAARKRCAGIRVEHVDQSSDPLAGRWVFKATVLKAALRKASSATAMPILLTRLPWSVAPKCGLPKRGPSIALCARLMESGFARSRNSAHSHPLSRLRTRGKAVGQSNGNGSANGQPRLRDKLCLLIRKYELDPNLVKTLRS